MAVGRTGPAHFAGGVGMLCAGSRHGDEVGFGLTKRELGLVGESFRDGQKVDERRGRLTTSYRYLSKDCVWTTRRTRRFGVADRRLTESANKRVRADDSQHEHQHKHKDISTLRCIVTESYTDGLCS